MPTYSSNSRLSALIDQIKRSPRGEQRLALCERALDLMQREDDPELWARLQCEAGMSMASSYQRDGLVQALRHYEQALEVYTPATYPVEWAATLHNVAMIRKEQRDFAAACELCEEIAGSCNPRRFPHQWALAHYELARLHAWHMPEPGQAHITRALDHCRQAITGWTRAGRAVDLANARDLMGTLYRHQLEGDRKENLQQALQYHQAALDMLEPYRRTEALTWARVQHNIGTTLFQMYDLSAGSPDLLDGALVHFQNALTVRQRQTYPEQWAATLHNMAVIYLKRPHGQRAASVEQAIVWLTDILEVRTRASAPAEWAESQIALGNAFMQRLEGGRLENIERAIGCYQAAAAAQDQLHLIQAMAATLHNLAVAYSERLAGARRPNLEQAVAYGKTALERADPQDVDLWGLITVDLVDMLWKLSQLVPAQAADHLERAIDHGETAVKQLKGTPYTHRQALAYYNLGNAYGDRLLGDRARNQDKAIECYQHALNLFADKSISRKVDTHNNIGVTYLEYSEGNRDEHLANAIYHFNRALEICPPDSYPESVRRAASNLGNLHFEKRRWQESANAYQRALEAAETIYHFSLLRLSKEVELADTAKLYRHAAYAMAQTGNLENAAVALEQSRARLLAEVLERNRLDLEKLQTTDHSGLFRRYQTAANEIAELEQRELRSEAPARSLELADELHTAHAALQSAIAEIQQIPDYRDFFRATTYDQIQHTLAEEDAVGVYVVATSAGGLALIVHHADVQAVWLDLTESDVNAWLVEHNGEQPAGGYLAAQLGQAPLDAVLSDLLPQLADKIMVPVAEALRSRSPLEVTLIPCGRLALFPLHAAEYLVDGKTQCFMDEFTVAYAPSARALGNCREGLKGVADQSPTLLSVGNPLPVPDSMSQLLYAQAEAEEIAALFGRAATLLCEQQATRAAVEAQLGQTTHVHLACHGTFNAPDPLQSGVLLSQGEMLAVKDLLSKRQLQGIRLVVLSACQTAITDFSHLPEEAIGLPAGFVQARATAVIGTLWPVNDLSALLLMIKFYEYHINDHQSPALALRHAQCWLRDASNAEISRLFARLNQSALDRPHADAAPVILGLAQQQSSRYAMKPPHKRPFADPFHWAPFVLFGA